MCFYLFVDRGKYTCIYRFNFWTGNILMLYKVEKHKLIKSENYVSVTSFSSSFFPKVNNICFLYILPKNLYICKHLLITNVWKFPLLWKFCVFIYITIYRHWMIVSRYCLKHNCQVMLLPVIFAMSFVLASILSITLSLLWIS